MTLDELRGLAERATRGEWWWQTASFDEDGFVEADKADPSHPYNIQILGDDKTLYPTYRDDCAFIAAFNPVTALALIARLREAERRLHEVWIRAVVRINSHQKFCVLCQSPIAPTEQFFHDPDCPIGGLEYREQCEPRDIASDNPPPTSGVS